MNNNLYNFDVDGNILADYIQDIDASNIVNGKPIYYLVNEKKRVIDSLSNAGYVGVVNSSNITVRDLNITNNRQGVFFAYVTDSKVKNVNVSNSYMSIYLTKSNNNILINNTAYSNEWFGIYLHCSDSNTLTNNNASGTKMASWGNGINLFYSDNNILADNTAYSNNRSGISLDESNNNMVTNNTVYSNNRVGIEMGRLNNNTLTDNTAYYNKHGIMMYSSRNNMVANNDVKSNTITGIYLFVSYNNLIYHNNMINNTKQAYCTGYNNSWDNGYPSGGNYWSDYTGVDLYHGQYQNITGSDGIGDSPYINISGSAGVQDRYPFIKESGWAPISTIFDTGPGTYPSIMGTYNGTIKPNQTITVSTLYTYPCPGTGGHTEYARIWNSSLDTNATRNGYIDDWHNISFNKSFTLIKDEIYNYTIRTGSYPQIIHARSKPVTGGLINCTEFTDANGKIYDNWIPAIRLYHN